MEKLGQMNIPMLNRPWGTRNSETYILRERTVRFNVGFHMQVYVVTSPDYKWLNDGTRIRPGNKIGEMHLSRRMGRIKDRKHVVSYTREFLRATIDSLSDLARLCQEDCPELREVVAFEGVSHLSSSIAERLGFEVLPLRRKRDKVLYSIFSKEAVLIVGLPSRILDRTFWSLPEAKMALISRKKLVELYSPCKEV